MSSLWGAEHCRLYRPGHLVHHIQASLSRREPREPRAGLVVATGASTVTVDLDGEHRVYRNHSALRIGQLAASLGPRVVVDQRWHIFRFEQEGHDLVFCVARSDAEWQPCRAADLGEVGLSPLGEVLIREGGPGEQVIGDPRT